MAISPEARFARDFTALDRRFLADIGHAFEPRAEVMIAPELYQSVVDANDRVVGINHRLRRQGRKRRRVAQQLRRERDLWLRVACAELVLIAAGLLVWWGSALP